MANVNCGACGHLNSRGYCNLTACIFPCSFGTGGYINKPATNADRIRGMSDEELAEILHNAGGNWYSEEYWLNWLKQNAD